MRKERSGTISGAPPVISMAWNRNLSANAMTADMVSRDMTSRRSGPASRWQSRQPEVAQKARVDLESVDLSAYQGKAMPLQGRIERLERDRPLRRGLSREPGFRLFRHNAISTGARHRYMDRLSAIFLIWTP